VASVIHGIAAIKHRRRDLVGAIAGYASALRLRENLFGPDHPDLAPTLIGLADAFRHRDELVTADQLYARALAILIPVVADDHPALRLARRGLASCRPQRCVP
jgi:hypothetical protein